MYRSIHALYADTLVLRPLDVQSVKKTIKKLVVICFLLNCLYSDADPGCSCWFQLRSRHLATEGWQLGRQRQSIIETEFNLVGQSELDDWERTLYIWAWEFVVFIGSNAGTVVRNIFANGRVQFAVGVRPNRNFGLLQFSGRKWAWNWTKMIHAV